MIIRRLMVPLAAAVVVAHAGQALAQSPFPTPLPNAGIIKNDPAFPPVNGAGPAPSFGASGSLPANSAPPNSSPFDRAPAPPTQAGGGDDCMKGFLPLRAEAERRGKLIKAANDRHAQADEACKLFTSFGQVEIKMIKFIEDHAARCGIPPQAADQLKAGHKNTERIQKQACTVAEQAKQRGPVGPSLSEVLGSSASVPEVTKKGGSTFDTLNGNVLTR